MASKCLNCNLSFEMFFMNTSSLFYIIRSKGAGDLCTCSTVGFYDFCKSCMCFIMNDHDSTSLNQCRACSFKPAPSGLSGLWNVLITVQVVPLLVIFRASFWKSCEANMFFCFCARVACITFFLLLFSALCLPIFLYKQWDEPLWVHLKGSLWGQPLWSKVRVQALKKPKTSAAD